MNEIAQHLIRYQQSLNEMGKAQSDAEYEQALIQNEESSDTLLRLGCQFNFGKNHTHVWSVSVERTN